MILAFDTETKGFDWWGDELAFIATTYDSNGQNIVYDFSNPDHVLDFKAHVEAADIIVAHNLSFDTHQVRATIGLDITETDAVLHDTDLMARVAWPEASYGEHGGFGLKNLAKVYIDPEADADETGIKEAAKAMGMRTLNKTGAYYDVWRAHPSVMEKYALSDARYTYELFLLLRDYLDDDERTGQHYIYYEVEQPAVYRFIQAEKEGVPVHRQKVKALHKDYLKRQKALFSSLETQLGPVALGGEGSEDALIEAFLKNGVPLVEKTDSGKLATNKFALQPFAKDHPVIAEYQEYATVNKFLSTYIEPMLKTDVIHPSFRQIGAWTGRSSCMRPNMQNIPVRAGSEVRDVFVAPEGYRFIVADYDSIEMRILAYYLGEAGQPYRDLINSGHDAHAWMASKLYGGTMEDYLKGTPGEKQRSIAKNTLFAIVYGAGGCRVCDMNDLPKGPPLGPNAWKVVNGYAEVGDPSCQQGVEMAKQIKNSIPGYNALMRRIRNKIEAHGYVNTLLGRRQAVSAEKSYVGMSALVQGSAGDVFKAGVIKAGEALDPFGASIRLFVHDEVAALARVEVADEALAAMQAALESAVPLDPPLLTSGTVARSYGEAK